MLKRVWCDHTRANRDVCWECDQRVCPRCSVTVRVSGKALGVPLSDPRWYRIRRARRCYECCEAILNGRVA